MPKDNFKVLRLTGRGVVIPLSFLKQHGFIPFKIEKGKVIREGTKFITTVYEDGTIQLQPVARVRVVK